MRMYIYIHIRMYIHIHMLQQAQVAFSGLATVPACRRLSSPGKKSHEEKALTETQQDIKCRSSVPESVRDSVNTGIRAPLGQGIESLRLRELGELGWVFHDSYDLEMRAAKKYLFQPPNSTSGAFASAIAAIALQLISSFTRCGGASHCGVGLLQFCCEFC